MFYNLRSTARTFTNLGIELPEPCTKALALADAITEATTTTAVADLNTGILDGDVTPANVVKKLQDAATATLVAERLPVAAQATESALTGVFHKGIRDAADDLIEQLREPFDAAAATVTAAGRHFEPEANAATVLSAGVEAAAAWQDLTEARNTLAQVRNARTIIADIQRDTTHPALFYVAGPLTANDVWEVKHNWGGTGDFYHQLTHQGYTLALNTSEEAKAIQYAAYSAAEREAADGEATARAIREADQNSEPAIRAAMMAAHRA